MDFILSCFYFFLPAYLANMTPPLLKRAGILTFLGKRVDFGKKHNEIPIFGSHKTWRGLIGGTLIGIITAFIQLLLFDFSFFQKISLINYNQINIFLFGFLLSLGALTGDLLFSFIKRRKNLKPGAVWIPFDQVDYVIGAFLIVTPYINLDVIIWITILFMSFFLNMIVNYVGFKLGLSESKL